MTQRRIYQCAFPYFVTFNVLYREWIFDDVYKADMLHEIILNAGKLKNHWVYQFCIMPDHVHILCQTKPVRRLSPRGLENPRCDRGDSSVGIGSVGIGSVDISSVGIGSVGIGSVGIGSVGIGSVDFPVRDATTRDTICDCGLIHQYTISDFTKSIRGTFSRYIQKGRIWHPRFYDRIVSGDKQFTGIISYITNNPLGAGLPKKWQKYPYQFKDEDLINLIAS
ncbi:transposase [Candidatus Peregrinibacteria bacterium]|nr:transposase [Candidatus Peregrinibacteria bacterium]